MLRNLGEQMRGLHASLADANIPHAFGGALALAWCIGNPRGTVDIDLNIFVTHDSADAALRALPNGVAVTEKDRHQISRDAQARVWWEGTAVDLFFGNTDFHDEVGTRVRWELLGETTIPFIDCADLAVFKAFFDRGKDWVDIEEMLKAETIDVDWVLGTLVRHLGGADHRVERLRRLSKLIDDNRGVEIPYPIFPRAPAVDEDR